MENRVICGDFWDFNAATVACRELGLGTPKEAFTTSKYGAPSRQYQSVIPVCEGTESTLDECKMLPNDQACTVPAGIVCGRVNADQGATLLDGLPVCADGFSNVEARAMCQAQGLKGGLVSNTTSSTSVPTGWSLQCQTGNLDNCQKSVCTQGTAAEYECDEELIEVALYGGPKPGQGTVIFEGGLVCDDSWDLNVRS